MNGLQGGGVDFGSLFEEIQPFPAAGSMRTRQRALPPLSVWNRKRESQSKAAG